VFQVLRFTANAFSLILLISCGRLSQPTVGANQGQQNVMGDRGEGLDVLSYSLKGNFRWETNRLEAEVKIEFEQTKLNYLTLDSKVAWVKSVRSSNGALLPFALGQNDTLVIQFPNHKSGPLHETVVIDYEALANSLPSGADSGLSAIPARTGDAVKSRVVYTKSEPNKASDWMPCHNVPSDRARFSATFTMPGTENMISNGDRISDSWKGEARVVSYATKYTLPPYLMAFVVGEFQSSQEIHAGKTPVSVWSRRGLAGDFNGMARELAGFLVSYEKLLVPYPFEKYTLVLFPEFPSTGAENAGITFQEEPSGT